jgi:hypothetical protein
LRAPVPGRLAALAALLVAAPLAAQELEPRAYSNAPVGLNFLILGYTYLDGGIATDPTAPIQNAELEVHGPLLAYARAIELLGRSAKIDVVVPYGFLSGSAEAGGVLHEREVSGLWDPRVRLSVNLLGAPALAPAEFRGWKQDWILGASLQVGLPVGQYDESRLANLGNNRWLVKPELGFSKAFGPLIVELAAAANFYGDNDDYYGGVRREQEPVYSLQAHLVWTFPSRIWVALDGTTYVGGETTVGGVEKDDRIESSRIGASLSLPFGRRNSVKLYAHTGVAARAGVDFDAVGAAWQHRWGGGL